MNIAEKIKSIFTKSNGGVEITSIKNTNKFLGISMQVIDKIKKTPCWKEYPQESKERMISKYFDKKMKTSEYMSIPYDNNDKQTFINEILNFVV